MAVVNAKTHEASDNLVSSEWNVQAAHGRAIADVHIMALKIAPEFMDEGKVEQMSLEARVAELEKEQE